MDLPANEHYGTPFSIELNQEPFLVSVDFDQDDMPPWRCEVHIRGDLRFTVFGDQIRDIVEQVRVLPCPYDWALREWTEAISFFVREIVDAAEDMANEDGE